MDNSSVTSLIDEDGDFVVRQIEEDAIYEIWGWWANCLNSYNVSIYYNDRKRSFQEDLPSNIILTDCVDYR